MLLNHLPIPPFTGIKEFPGEKFSVLTILYYLSENVSSDHSAYQITKACLKQHNSIGETLSDAAATVYHGWSSSLKV